MKRKFTKYPKSITASKMSDIDLLAREALECTTKDELAAVISGLDSLGLRKLFLRYTEMLRDPSLSVPYIASQLSDELICYYSGKDVNACGNVMASEICYRDRNNDDRVVALDVGMSDEDVEEMLAAHPSYYRSTLDRFDDIDACDKVTAATRPHPPIPSGWERVPEGDDDEGNWGTIAKALPDNQGYYWINVIEDEQGRRCFELEVGYRGDDGSIGQIWKAASKPFYRLGDIVKYADTKWRQLQNENDEDIDACDKVMAAIHVGEFDLERSESNVENDLGVTARDDGDWIYFLSDDDATHMPSSCYDMNSYYTKLIKNRNYNGFKPKKLSYKSFENSVNKLVDSSSSLDEFETKYHSFLCSLIGLDVDACDNVMASSRYEPDDSGIESYQAQCRSKKDNVLCIKYDNNQIDRYKFHSIDGLGDVFEPETGSGNWWTSYIVTPDNKLLSWQFNGRYTPVDATYGEDFWIETASAENVEATTGPKYFANMVSASTDDGDYKYYVAGYYDNLMRGLSDNLSTDSFDAVLEFANELANDGCFIQIKNLITGSEVYYDANVWLEAIENGDVPEDVFEVTM